MKRDGNRRSGAEDAATRRVERLLHQARVWEPEQEAPGDLAHRALQRLSKPAARRPIWIEGGALSMGAVAAAVIVVCLVRMNAAAPSPQHVAAAAVMPKTVPMPVLPAADPVSVLPPTLTEPQSAGKTAASPVANRPRLRHLARRADWHPERRPILLAEQNPDPAPVGPVTGKTAPPDSRAIPASAVALDDAPPTLVPVVLAEEAPDGSGPRLTPLVMALPASGDNGKTLASAAESAVEP